MLKQVQHKKYVYLYETPHTHTHRVERDWASNENNRGSWQYEYKIEYCVNYTMNLFVKWLHDSVHRYKINIPSVG